MAQVVKVLAMQAGGPELAPRSHAKSQARWHTLIIAAWEGGARGALGFTDQPAQPTRWTLGLGRDLSQN